MRTAFVAYALGWVLANRPPSTTMYVLGDWGFVASTVSLCALATIGLARWLSTLWARKHGKPASE